MAGIYYIRIKADLMTIDQVPLLWQAEVQELLDKERA